MQVKPSWPVLNQFSKVVTWFKEIKQFGDIKSMFQIFQYFHGLVYHSRGVDGLGGPRAGPRNLGVYNGPGPKEARPG